MCSQKWRRLVSLILLSLPSLVVATDGNHASIREPFYNAAKTAASRTLVPVYAPLSLQSLDAYAKDGCVFGHSTRRSFELTLYGRVTEYGKSEPLPCEGSSGAFLAAIHGDIKPLRDLSSMNRAQRVALAGNRSGWFVPISCGGSCSPATLYWQTQGGSYRLQLKLAPTASESEQREQLLASEKSMVRVRAESK